MERDMRLLVAIFLMLTFTVFSFGAADALSWNNVRLAAISINGDGAIRHLSGQVQIETNAVLIRADQADYNSQTHEVNASGSVKITLK